MAKEYELTAFDTGKEPYVDQHGNTWVTAVFLGEGEPVKWVVKETSALTIGNSYYGSITEEKSKAGKPYLRFRREKRPDQVSTPTKKNDWKPDEEYWSDKDSTIKAQFAIKAAVELLKNPEADIAEDTVEHWAKIFFNMVERVAANEDAKEPNVNVEDLPL